MKKNDTDCKHKPQYSPQIIYGGKNRIYICKNCGKSIKVDSTAEKLFVLVGTIIFIVMGSFAESLNILYIMLLILPLMVWFPGSYIYFSLLSYHEVQDKLTSTTGEDKID